MMGAVVSSDIPSPSKLRGRNGGQCHKLQASWQTVPRAGYWFKRVSYGKETDFSAELIEPFDCGNQEDRGKEDNSALN